MNLEDGLVIIEFYENADSFGWSIKALFSAHYRFNQPPRWGTLDALASTDHGSGDSQNAMPDTQDKRDCIRRLWHLVDWHISEDLARQAMKHMKERLW